MRTDAKMKICYRTTIRCALSACTLSVTSTLTSSSTSRNTLSGLDGCSRTHSVSCLPTLLVSNNGWRH